MESLIDLTASTLTNRLGLPDDPHYRAWDLPDSFLEDRLRGLPGLVESYLGARAGGDEKDIQFSRADLLDDVESLTLASVVALGFAAPQVRVPGYLWPAGVAAARVAIGDIEGLRLIEAAERTSAVLASSPISCSAPPLWEADWHILAVGSMSGDFVETELQRWRDRLRELLR